MTGQADSYNEYDIITKDIIAELGYTCYTSAKQIDELEKVSNLNHYQFRRACTLYNDIFYTPKIANQESFEEFRVQSLDYRYSKMKLKDDNLKLPSLETLIKNEIHLINYPNFRYYEEDLNATTLHITRCKSYSSFESVVWDDWHVICHVGEENITIDKVAYIVRGVPKFCFEKYRKIDYLEWSK